MKSKVGNFKCLKEKGQSNNIAKQLPQTVQKIEAKPQPAHPFSIISFPSFSLKTTNHIVKRCFSLYPFFSLLQTASIFYPINPPSSLKRKKFVQHENFKWMKKLTFSFERRMSQATYKNLGKGNLFTFENSSGEKMKHYDGMTEMLHLMNVAIKFIALLFKNYKK